MGRVTSFCIVVDNNVHLLMNFRFLRVSAVLRSNSTFAVRANFLSFCLETSSFVNCLSFDSVELLFTKEETLDYIFSAALF
jgi:hypothetical protein